MTTKKKQSKGPAGMTEQELKDVKSNQKTKFFKKIIKDKLIPSIGRGEGTGASRNAITDKLKEMTPSLLEKIKSAKALQTDKMPTTVAEAKEQGWKMGSTMMMSDPPVFTFTKDGQTIQIRGDTPDYLKRMERPMKKGGEVKRYKAGGEVKKKKSKLAGRLAMRGYGIARK